MPPPKTPAVHDLPLSRRHLLTMISAIMALTAVAIDLMLPAFDEIRVAFDLRDGSADTGRIVTYFFFGLAAAQMVYGPLTDRFGRKPVLYLGITIYIVGAIGSAVAPTFGILLASRFVWGVGAAGSRVVAIAIVRDRFEGPAMAKAMSQIMAVFVLVPVFAPTIGAGIVAVLPWRAAFWFCVVWAVAIAVWSVRLPETLAPSDRRSLSLSSTARGFAEVATTPITAGYTLASVFLQGVFTVYLASSEVIISEIFDRRSEFPFVFGGVATLFGVGAFVNGRVVDRVGIDRVVTIVLTIMVPLNALLVIETLGASEPNFWVFMPTLGLILAGFMFLLPNLNSAAMEPVGHIAGTASSMTGAVRIALGAVLGTVISNQITDSVRPFAVGVAAMCGAAGLCVVAVRVGTRRQRLALAAETPSIAHDSRRRVAVADAQI
ncbi:MAG: multidrug effflux MFS transporter [Ilumatobacteraceae bacterium]